jgi:hypothetical protein
VIVSVKDSDSGIIEDEAVEGFSPSPNIPGEMFIASAMLDGCPNLEAAYTESQGIVADLNLALKISPGSTCR